LPKIGTQIEKAILKKLAKKSKGKTVGSFLKKEGISIWYHNSPQYWIHVHPEKYVPRVEYYEGYKEGEETPHNLQNIRISDQYKPLLIKPEHSAIVNGLMNSHLFYWWYVIWSDGRHLLLQHIENFPLNLIDFPANLNEKLTLLVNRLMEDYEKNANIKINARSGGYVIKIKEIIPKISKDILDEINDVFVEYFGFSEKEKDFIKDFDVDFRM